MVAQFDGFEINPVHQGDAWKICGLCVANADRFKRFFPQTLELNLTPTLSELFVKEKMKLFQNREQFLFTLKQSETRKLVGLLYLKELDWDKKQGEFAYCIDYTFKGNGLITKAIKKLSKLAFEDLGLEILQIIVNKDNTGSVNVAKNNGFEWQMTNEKAFTPPGEQALDMEVYELYKS